jgi:hypothetical protein
VADDPYLFAQDGEKEAPYSYTIPGALELFPSSITARYDGSGAATAFRPCVSIYAQSGELISRTFPSETVAAGDKAEVTFLPFFRGGQGAGDAIRFNVENDGDYVLIRLSDVNASPNEFDIVKETGNAAGGIYGLLKARAFGDGNIFGIQAFEAIAEAINAGGNGSALAVRAIADSNQTGFATGIEARAIQPDVNGNARPIEAFVGPSGAPQQVFYIDSDGNLHIPVGAGVIADLPNPLPY